MDRRNNGDRELLTGLACLARTANMRWHGRSRETERGSVVSARRTDDASRSCSSRRRARVVASSASVGWAFMYEKQPRQTFRSALEAHVERDANPFSRSSSCVVIEAMRKGNEAASRHGCREPPPPPSRRVTCTQQQLSFCGPLLSSSC